MKYYKVKSSLNDSVQGWFMFFRKGNFVLFAILHTSLGEYSHLTKD